KVVFGEGDAPITGANVTISGALTRTARTGDDGTFSFDDLPLGRYTLTIAAPGYDRLDIEEDFKKPETLEVRYRLVATAGAYDVTIRGNRPPREVVKRTLEQREISRI